MTSRPFTRDPTTGRVYLEPPRLGPWRHVGTEGGGWERRPLPGAPRVVRLQPLGPPRQPLRVPVVGEVAASAPEVSVFYAGPADGDPEVLTVDREALDPGTEHCFALRVRGTSMIDLGIRPGDLVLVRPQRLARDGDLVVALLRGEDDPQGHVTLKRFRMRGDRVVLEPANPEMAPIYLLPDPSLGGDPLEIQGVVVAVLSER